MMSTAVCQETTVALHNFNIQQWFHKYNLEILEESNNEYLQPEMVKGAVTDLYLQRLYH